VLFGSAALLGMLKALNFGPGLIFDGRSVMVSLCALYFGPWAALVSASMVVVYRLSIGGSGVVMGVLVTLTSASIGLFGRYKIHPERRPPSLAQLYVFGLIVHIVMLALMLTLPKGTGITIMKRIGPIVIVLYPLATILAGKILSDQIKTRMAMTALKRREEHLIRNLSEKEILLSEVHHRVKNNLNIISSLLSLQASTIKTPGQAIAAFQNSGERIMAMSLVHEELYKSRNFAGVDMGEYIDKLAKQLELAYDASGRRVQLKINTSGVLLSVEASIPCGLILNELVTNAFKYAFPERRSGTITIEMRETEDGYVELDEADDGVGLPDDFADSGGEESGSLGLTLVRLLVAQLDGTMKVTTEGGTAFRIRFPKRSAS
jgi:two-component sensor histidine kinase